MSKVDLERLIKEKIRQEGPITFAEFMDLALYHAPGGYYASGGSRIGPQSDFYTSPLAHPAFGALIALQLEQMWELMERPSPFTVVELGSGKGVLARDILGYGKNLSRGFRGALKYICVDRAPERPEAEWETLASAGIPLRGIRGCILSNELVDAVPVHRVIQQAGSLKEILVTVKEGELVEVIGEPSTPSLRDRLDDLRIELGEGQETEINLVIEEWARDVATSLAEGYVITIDYGHPAKELYSPERPKGTLMCHYRHTTNRSPLRRVGEQDITAHVDFTSLIAAGERYGLETCGVVAQGQFLTNLGIGGFAESLPALGLPPGQSYSNRMGMNNLIDPQGLGKFWVLIQGKDNASRRLEGLRPAPPAKGDSLVEKRGLPVPLLTPHHIDLLGGRYPHLTWEPEG